MNLIKFFKYIKVQFNFIYYMFMKLYLDDIIIFLKINE